MNTNTLRNTFALLLCILITQGASAAGMPYLVGVNIYASGPDGDNEGAYSGTPYQYSTNSSISAEDLFLNGAPINTTFELSAGDNLFSFSPASSGFPIDRIGINLFFSLSDASYNPAYDPGLPIPGHLTAFVDAGSGAFAVPLAGLITQSFNTSGTSPIAATTNGSTSWSLGDWDLSVTALQATNQPSGSFTIHASQSSSVPAPASLALFGLGFAGLALTRRKRSVL